MTNTSKYSLLAALLFICSSCYSTEPREDTDGGANTYRTSTDSALNIDSSDRFDPIGNGAKTSDTSDNYASRQTSFDTSRWVTDDTSQDTGKPNTGPTTSQWDTMIDTTVPDTGAPTRDTFWSPSTDTDSLVEYPTDTETDFGVETEFQTEWRETDTVLSYNTDTETEAHLSQETDTTLESECGDVVLDGSFQATTTAAVQAMSAYTHVRGDVIIFFDTPADNLNAMSNLKCVDNTLSIQGAGVLSLAGLEELKQVGALTIEQTSSLEELTGLNPDLRFEEVDDFLPPTLKIINNNALEYIDIFEQADTLMVLNVTGNPELLELAGFGNLPDLMSEIIIQNNVVLETLPGLEGVGGTAELTIMDNPSLVDLSGLERLTGAGELNVINNDMLVNMAPLESFTSAGPITISGNDALVDLEGLDYLTGCSQFIVSDNAMLQSLDDLTSFTSTGGLQISDNPSLTNLSGLFQISGAGTIEISNNDALESLDGMNLVGLGILTVAYNDSLLTLSGLETLQSSGEVHIIGNSLLGDVAGLSNIGTTGVLEITDNGVLPYCAICDVFSGTIDSTTSEVTSSGNLADDCYANNDILCPQD